MNVHLSFDDVHLLFIELQNNNYKSIFQTRFLKTLKYFHSKYNCKFSLYVFYENKDFCLDKITSKYADEFASINDWLQFNFHSVSPDKTLVDFETAFHNTLANLQRIAKINTYTNTVRLHCFSASENEIELLKKNNITYLLGADDERISYDLSNDENSKLIESGKYIKDNITYIRTNIRLENRNYFTNLKKVINNKYDPIIIFSHEWLFNGHSQIKMWYRLLKVIKFLSKYSTNYITNIDKNA